MHNNKCYRKGVSNFLVFSFCCLVLACFLTLGTTIEHFEQFINRIVLLLSHPASTVIGASHELSTCLSRCRHQSWSTCKVPLRETAMRSFSHPCFTNTGDGRLFDFEIQMRRIQNRACAWSGVEVTGITSTSVNFYSAVFLFICSDAEFWACAQSVVGDRDIPFCRPCAGTVWRPASEEREAISLPGLLLSWYCDRYSDYLIEPFLRLYVPALCAPLLLFSKICLWLWR